MPEDGDTLTVYDPDIGEDTTYVFHKGVFFDRWVNPVTGKKTKVISR